LVYVVKVLISRLACLRLRMILVTIKIAVRSTKQKELAQTLCALAGLVRKEVGCVSSAFYCDVEKENALCVLEEWESQAYLDTHLGSDNFRVLRGAVKLLNGPTQMRFHSVSQTLGEEAVEAARDRRAGGR
jgi:quinol monooxygenase YgiN